MFVCCAECGDRIEDLAHDLTVVDGRSYHWSCAQELFERERLADGLDS